MTRKSLPSESPMGALISDNVANKLSAQLSILGAQWQEICAELTNAGYGRPSVVERAAIQEFATKAEDIAQLHDYWGEWAKERLAGLVGPINILRGKYPKICAYRSELIARLRDDLVNGKVRSIGPIVSPQMEPTLKQYIERLPDDPTSKKVHEAIKESMESAALSLHLKEKSEFISLSADDRYELLIDRYRSALDVTGFSLDSHRKTGLIFRKITSNKEWAFLLVDESREGMGIGMLSPTFALTLPKKAVLPCAVSLSAVATFSPDDLVPRFRTSCFFAKDSYSQFCLAADSIAFLAKVVYERLDRLLE